MDTNDILYSVLSMLAVDGNIDKQEMEFLQKLCKHLGLSQEAFNTAFENVKQGKGSIRFSDNAAENTQLFDLFVQAAAADGTIAPQERQVLDAAAAKMGIAGTEVEKALKARLGKSTPQPSASKPPATTGPQKYNVVFHGKIAEGKDPEKVKNKLAALFKMDRANVGRLFTGKRTIVKQNTNQQTALKFKKAFVQAGAICAIEPANKPSPKKSEKVTPIPKKPEKVTPIPKKPEKTAPKTPEKKSGVKKTLSAAPSQPSREKKNAQKSPSEKNVVKKIDARTIERMIEKKRMSGQWTFKQLFSIFDSLTDYDVQIEAKLAKFKMFTAIIFFGGLVPGVIGLFASTNYPGLIYFAVLLLVVAGIGGSVGGLLILKYKNLDLSNEFREYMQPLLEELEDDIKQDREISVNLYLSPVEQKEFSKGKGEKYESMGYKCQEYLFERDLATIKIRLSDGNRAMLSVHEVLIKTKKSKWKRSRSGKMKHKSKTKRQKRVTCDVRVIANSKKFSCKKIPPGGEQKMYSKQSKGHVILGLKYTEKLKNETHLIPDPIMMVRGFVTLYTFLQPKAQHNA